MIMTEANTPPSVPLPDHLASLASTKTVDRLAESLVASGAESDVARAIANATTDPAAFRRSLPTPVAFRTPFGDLKAVFTRVWAPAVIPFATNTRVSPELGYAVAGDTSSRPLGRLASAERDSAVLLVDAPDRETIGRVLARVAHAVEAENPLALDIGHNGVQEPITLVPVTFTSQSDGSELTVLSAADGSSRVAGAHRNLGLTPDVVAFRYAADPVQLRSRIGRSARASRTDLADLDASELIELNSLTIPAFVIVGFRPISPGNGDFARAVTSRVGAIHVSPPKPWRAGARLDAQLDAVLDALLVEDFLDEDWFRYYSGDLTPEAAKDAGLSPYPDVRGANLAIDLQNADLVRTINAALRTVSLKSPSPRERASVAAEGALRAFRHEVSESDSTAARNLLRHLYAVHEIRERSTYSVGEEVEVLRDAALDGDERSGRDLLLLAFYWFAARRLVRRTTRGGEQDRTDIAEVLKGMTTTASGLHQLYQLIVDSRVGIQPRQVEADGSIRLSEETNEPFRLTEARIRERWSQKTSDNSDDVPQSPEGELLSQQAIVRTAVDKLQEAVAGLRDPRGDDGEPIIKSVLLAPDFVDTIGTVLSAKVMATLQRYRREDLEDG